MARVRSGDRLRVQLLDSSTGQLGPTSATSDLGSIDLARVDAATGPIEVIGAHPGDCVDVHIRRIRPGPWGWSGVFRDFGLLRGRFDDELQHWRVGAAMASPIAGFVPPVRIPLRPTLGWVGLAPLSGPHPMIPPRRTGGNLDHRLVGAGSTLSLPVEVDGALLSLGDPHAAQGDGEVCGTGIEVAAEVELEVALHRGGARAMPHLRSPAPAGHPGPQIACLGVGPDPGAAAVVALEGLLVEFERRGVPAKAGYVLASVAGELRITEAVDMPNYVVSASYPERLMPSGRKVKRHRGSAARRNGSG
ncbi:MAG: acetamidase/formamidase family protein [Thermoplasmata archaeon]|nr:acetamidase/formamidase family protein [Thermoplasmata archaeon]MCI4356048.1 acetamidase/formamidase family protein [Thermoplasmata archaeon]